MKRVALALATIGVLGVATSQALAEGALSYPMAAHVAAKYGIQHPGHHPKVQQHHAREYYRQQYPRHGQHGYPRHYRHRPVVVYPRYPTVVVPYAVPYYPRPYYYVPYRGLQYYGSGISFGIGF